jgi:hypothetical protein
MEGWVEECVLPIIHSSILPPQVERAASPAISAFRVRRYADTALSPPAYIAGVNSAKIFLSLIAATRW